MPLRSRAAKANDKPESAVEPTETAAARLASETKDKIIGMGASVGRTAEEAVDQVSQSVSHRLKKAGVDPDVMAEAAKNQASKLQQVIEDELQTRPVRTLAVAAAVGLVVGLLANR